MYVVGMEMERCSNDQVDQVLGQLLSGLAVFHAQVCSWLIEVDRGQRFLADGSPDLVQWLSARFGLRHSTAGLLVRVARRLQAARSPRALRRWRPVLGSGGCHLEDGHRRHGGGVDRGVSRAVYCCSGSCCPESKPADDPGRTGDVATSLSVHPPQSGRLEGKLTAHLPGPDLHVVESAIRAGADRVPPNPETGMFDPYPARMADGLVELAATSGDGSPGPVPVTVHADLEALTETGVTGGCPSSRQARSSQTRPPDGWPVMPWWSAPSMTMLALSASGGGPD